MPIIQFSLQRRLSRYQFRRCGGKDFIGKAKSPQRAFGFTQSLGDPTTQEGPYKT